MHPYHKQDSTFTGLCDGYEVLLTAPNRPSFNGKENDNEVKGEGNQQDYGFRVHDTRTGRFLSIDPLFAGYPWNSTYAFAENSPIGNTDLDGLEKCPAQDDKSTQNKDRTPIEVVKDIFTGILSDFNTSADNLANPETKVGVFKAIVSTLNIAALFILPEAIETDVAETASNAKKTERAASNTPHAEQVAGNVQRVENTTVKVERAKNVAAKSQTNTTTSVAQNATAKVAAKTGSLVKIGTVEGDVMMFSSKIGAETVEGITNFAVKDGKLFLNKLHLEGSSAGNVV